MTPITIASPLREVAELKIAEFVQLKQDFKARYGIGSPRHADIAVRERLTQLIKDIQRFDSYLEVDDDLTIIASQVEQAGDDGYVSDDKLLKLEEKVLDKLRKRMVRLDATSLHLEIVKEAMDTAGCAKVPTPGIDALSLDDFDVVDDKLEALWEKLEVEAFTSKNVDTGALEIYLEGLLRGNDSLASVSRLRDRMREYGEDILVGDGDIEEDELEWCIMDLLKNELISNEKKKILEGYIQNQVAIKELLGVLNMKSVTDWTYKQQTKGVPVMARQDIEGQYHVTVEEDLVDMLYLHCMAIGWAQKLKDCLGDYFRYLDRVYKRHLTFEETKEREFFLEMMPSESEPSPPGSPGYCPPPPPPASASWGIPQGVYVTPVPVARKIGKKKKAPKIMYDCIDGLPAPPPPPPPPPMMIPPPPPPICVIPPMPTPYARNLDTMDDERHRIYKNTFFMSRLPTQDGCRPKVTPVEELQATLIKTLAAEVKIPTSLGDQVTCTVVDFHSLATALPHKTILVVLKVLGIPEVFVDFFARFLGANLNIGPSVRGTRERVLPRACGVPERHGMELLFTEAVMFFAELAVAKKTGLHLYRLGSKCYFVGTELQSDQAMQELVLFSERTKLDFDDVLPQPGCLHVGFLEISGNATIIRHSLVEEYAQRVKKQLAAQRTVYDWVRVWNGSIGTYAAHLFGPLVDLFGKSHLDAVKTAHKRIFDVAFDGGNLTDHIKSMLHTRSEFARTAPPLALEAFIYLPQSFGGLGVKNPFIALNLARNMISNPNEIIKDYLDVESKYYATALRNWSALTPSHIVNKRSHLLKDDDANLSTALNHIGSDGTFISQFALTRPRDYVLFPHLPLTLLPDNTPPPPSDFQIPYLLGLYQTLLHSPIETIPCSERLRDEVRECGAMKRWDHLDVLDQWVLGMYGDECLDTFGSLDVWCERFVPGVALVLLRGVQDVRDDDSYMSSGA